MLRPAELVLLSCLAAVIWPASLEAKGAQATQAKEAQPQKGPVEPDEYTGTTTGLATGDNEPVSIQIMRWSSDKERQDLIALIQAPPAGERADAEFLKRFHALPTVGFIWDSSSLGYALKYAHRAPGAKNSETIVLLAERRLGAFDRLGPWKAADRPNAPDYPFTILELRLNGSARGEGKMSLTTTYSVDAATNTLSLTDYDGSPVLLRNVAKRDRKGT